MIRRAIGREPPQWEGDSIYRTSAHELNIDSAGFISNHDECLRAFRRSFYLPRLGCRIKSSLQSLNFHIIPLTTTLHFDQLVPISKLRVEIRAFLIRQSN